ncbi:hypothetical protein APR50_19110 [Variovorax paradoxus]|jgi:hypothetical protein|uniref:hypothetical protein n=1 Tax=Variovorax TaxID=34072 RepID=UPI0006E4D254|nr:MULTISPECIES: hypothetical protein [unclassified Variovorax]KPU90907.1 hypothetical protein APR49_41225 [Variovorax paradoxus]KPU91236.1 hypothetical protein APR52_32340 [Variovorax paradoxus]KPV05548.1 hypothetical protein APR50_19110 [Variovorax paradoxus]KPV11172.1 hypothetical protein APR51_41945 [Variovorax paradoxus]KPV18591.1 hypothetical protein APR47_41425 [Variovorax paradoxus]
MTATGLRAACLAALLVLGGPGAHALGSDYGYDSFKTPDAVTWVQLCGAWGPNHQGTYRVVHAEQYAQSFLYVQWMARDANGSLQAAHTVAIAELDNDHAEIALSDLTCRATPRGIVLTAKADSGHDDKLRRVTIEVGPAPGQYRFRPQRTR